MKIFLDTADVEMIRPAYETGLIDGVTTNPSLILKSGRTLSEVAKELVTNHKLTQRKVAEKLGVTEAAVSRYISGKRGKEKKFDENIMHEIKKSANTILKEKRKTIVIEEICRICNLLKSTKFIENIDFCAG